MRKKLLLPSSGRIATVLLSMCLVSLVAMADSGGAAVATPVFQQQSTVTLRGQVVDAQGVPLPGVNILAKASGAGTVSDADGNFVFQAPADGPVVLVVSYIGFKTVEVTATPGKPLHIVLTDDSELLDEVLVTGYQTLSRERATGSFDKVDTKVLDSRPTSDLSSALQGLVAGMQAREKADGSMEFLIRGASSLYADRKPLLVVDGFPVQGDFSTINPNDVESVTVLKDAAAASIWGARSANGVIVVTTKKGSKERVKVDVKAFVRVGSTPDLDYALPIADSRTMVDYELKALENNWKMGSYEYTPGFSRLMGASLTLAQELIYANKYYGLSDADMKAGLERLRTVDNKPQIKRHLMRPQLLQQYNATLSGGTDRMSNYLSLMYEKNNEYMQKRGYQKFMVNYNNNYRVTRWLSVNMAASLQRRSQESSGATLGQLAILSPYEVLLNDDGSYAPNLYYYNRAELAKLPMNKMPYSDWSYNLLREVRGREYNSNITEYRMQFGLNANIVRGLTYDARVQYESATEEHFNYDGPETFATRNTVNYYTEFNNETNTVGISRLPKGGIVKSDKKELSNYVFRNQLNYSNQFADKHDLSALAGLEISQYDWKTIKYPWMYGYDKEKHTSSVPQYGYGSAVDGFKDFFGYDVEDLGGGNTSYQVRTDRFVSYYTNLGYTYDGKYGISFSARGDGSNFVSDKPALRWAPMWSVGAKWNIGQENFIQDIKWIDFLNLRATYGINGNAEKSTSPLTLISTSSSASRVTNTIVGSISSFGNPSLRWEKTYTTNLGVDFSLYKHRWSGKIDVYNRHSKDVIGSVMIPSAYGTSTQRFNTAEILNRGVELELTGNFRIPSAGVGISSTLTYAYNYNKILNLYNPSLYAFDLVSPSTFVEGRPIGSLHSYRFLGTENGVPYVIGANGDKISMNNVSVHNRALGLDILYYSGTTIPPHTFGWSNRISWKNFNLDVYFTGNFGGVFRAPTASTVPSVGSGKTAVSRFITEFAESDGTKRPMWPNKNETNFFLWNRYGDNLEYYVQDASFIRLKEINLEYTLPVNLCRQLHLAGAKVFMQARDLGVVYTANRYGYDPEWLPGSVKPVTTFALGANINF